MPQLKQIIKRSKMAKNHGRDSGDVAYRNKQGKCTHSFKSNQNGTALYF